MTGWVTSLGPAGSLLVLAGGLCLLISLPLLALGVWRRVRLRLTYSPVRQRRARYLAVSGLLLLGMGAGLLVLDAGFAAYEPVKTGEPAGIVRVQKGRVHLISAYDNTERDLGPVPGPAFAMVGDILVLPGWSERLGVPSTWHRIRSVVPPYVEPGKGESPPVEDRLYSLLASNWCPGIAETRRTPVLSAARSPMSLHFLGEGGYGLVPYGPGEPKP